MKDKSKRTCVIEERSKNKQSCQTCQTCQQTSSDFLFHLLATTATTTKNILLAFYFQKMVKKFSQLARGGGHAKKIVSSLHQYLETASNGDIDALLEHIYDQDKVSFH
jgi:isochorismate synthase EntC